MSCALVAQAQPRQSPRSAAQVLRHVGSAARIGHPMNVSRANHPTLAPQILRPFLRHLRAAQCAPSDFVDRFATVVEGDRMPATRAFALLREATELTGDPDLGLHAAMHLQLGDFQALEWVAVSASTWREATQTVCRYVRVVNETADYRIEVRGDRQHLILGSTVQLDRQMADYQLAAYHLAIRMRDPETPPDHEIWIARPKPPDIRAYQQIFPTSTLLFDAAFDGFVSPASRLDQAFPTANPPLHSVLRAHADHLLQQVGQGDSVIDRVSADIVETLGQERVTVERTAARLGMTRRTLSRHLSGHGTSFSEILQQVRYRSAMHYLRTTEQSIEDVAFLLSYSECAAFVRAFKRWSGRTPQDYRLHSGAEGE